MKRSVSLKIALTLLIVTSARGFAQETPDLIMAPITVLSIDGADSPNSKVSDFNGLIGPRQKRTDDRFVSRIQKSWSDGPAEVIDRPRSAIEVAEEERAEREDCIETDRDSFTPAVPTVGRNRFVLESAYSFNDERRGAETHSYPELLLRYGLTRRVELRLGWNLEVGGAGNETSGAAGFDLEEESTSAIERETVITYGVKVFLLDQNGLIPESSVILMARTPTSGPDTDTHFVGTWAFGWNVGSRWKFDGAMRYATASEEDDRFGVWAPSAVVKFELAERWNAHLEYFAFFSAGRSVDYDRHYVSPGVHYLVTDNLEVGARVGWGLNEQSSRFFVNVGVGWRY